MGRGRSLTAFSSGLLLAIACRDQTHSRAVGQEASALAPAGGPSFEWAQVIDSPARNDAAFAFDSRRGRLVVFGGYADSFVERNDTLEYDGGVWQPRFPLVRPPPRSKAAAAFDSDRGVTVMFGGGAWSRVMSDTWEWNGVDWRLVAVSTPPAGRLSAAMAYDSSRHRVVLHGGEGRNDTWEFDGINWLERTPAVRPAVSDALNIAFDRERGKAVLVLANNQTWEWEGATWTQKQSAPTPTFSGTALIYDSDRKRVRRFFDQSYADWDGTTWTRTDPAEIYPVRVGPSAAYDPTSHRIWMIDAFFSNAEVWEFHDDIWTARGTEADGQRPLFGTERTLVNTPSDGSLLLIATMSPTNALGLVHWGWTGGGWNWESDRTYSPPGTGPAALDTVRNRIVLLRGCETWESDGTSAWVQKTPARGWCSYGGATEGPLVFDRARARITMLRTDRVLEYDGLDWTSVVPPASPPAIAGAVYDMNLGKVVTYGETPGQGETWSWNGATWTSLHPTHSPSSAQRGGSDARAGFCMTYDPKRKRAMLFGGSGVTTFDDLWEWDGSDWSRVATGAGPSARLGCTLGYDTQHGQVVLFGGTSPGVGAQNDTWVLRSLGSACGTSDDCGLGSFCTDSVCCEARSCGTCENCGGREPGRCSPVASRDDADSCTGDSTCSALGECKLVAGRAATGASDCASGYLVDGVCCDTPCNGPCQACRADVKESGDRSGLCGSARAGTDPRQTCTEDAPDRCGFDGTCDGHGACRLRGIGVACGASVCVDNRATGKLCDGLGACGESSQGVSCGAYTCEDGRGCRTACTADAECGTGYRCLNQRCAVSETAFCDGERILRSPDGSGRDCGAYKCIDDACKTSCATVTDCVFPNECNAEGRCVSFGNLDPASEGGCSLGSKPAPGGISVVMGLLALAWRRWRRRP